MKQFITSKVERVKGIEPSSQAWEAHILPLNHTRIPPTTFAYQGPGRIATQAFTLSPRGSATQQLPFPPRAHLRPTSGLPPAPLGPTSGPPPACSSCLPARP